MRIRQAYALLLAMVGLMAASDCSSDSTGTGAKEPALTELTITWTFSGKPASAEECMTRGGTKVYVNLSGTIDPSLHQSVTEECAKGTVKFSALDIDKLGMPYLEGTLLDEKEATVTHEGLIVMPMAGPTSLTIDFFPMTGAGGSSSSSSSSASSSSASSSSASSSSASSGSGSSGSGGGVDAGADGG